MIINEHKIIQFELICSIFYFFNPLFLGESDTFVTISSIDSWLSWLDTASFLNLEATIPR